MEITTENLKEMTKKKIYNHSGYVINGELCKICEANRVPLCGTKECKQDKMCKDKQCPLHKWRK